MISVPMRACVALFILAPGACLTLQAISPEEAAAGREVLRQYADTVIGVELVATISGAQGDRPIPATERKFEVNGTVIGPGGLTVLSLGSFDPRVGLLPGIRLDEPQFKEVKLRLADGTEFPARIVLKDEDLDLAFVAPDPPADGAPPLPAFAHVDLGKAATAEVLGTYFDVARGNKRVQRVAAVRVVSVTAILEKPRRFFLATDYSPGCPVFDAAGRVLGLSVRQIAEGRPVGNIILPPSDIAEMAPQGPP
jgi:hypothetical protein